MEGSRQPLKIFNQGSTSTGGGGGLGQVLAKLPRGSRCLHEAPAEFLGAPARHLMAPDILSKVSTSLGQVPGFSAMLWKAPACSFGYGEALVD